MSFLNPLFLIGLSIVSIPIIIHILSRKKPRKIEFSYLKFLEIAARRAIKKFRLRQYLLLLIRCLIIILISLIFARPVIRYISSSENIETILLIDNSYSMNYYKDGITRLANAKESAKKIITLLKPGEKLSIFSFSDSLIPIVKNPTTDRRIVLSELENINLTHNKTDALNAIKESEKYFENKNTEKRIILFSDFAINGWSSKTSLANEQNKIIGIDVGDDNPDNFAVSGIDINNNSIGITIANYAGYDKRILASLYIDNIKYRDIFFNAESYKSITQNFNLKNISNGIHRCFLEIEPDKLTVDNKNFFAFNYQDKPKALLIDGNPQFSEFKGEVYFLNTALQNDTLTKVINYDQIDNESFDNYSIIFLCNVSELSRNNVIRLSEFISKNKNIVFFPGDKVKLDKYNTDMSSLFPCEFSSVLDGGELMNFGISDNAEIVKKVNIYKRFLLSPKLNSETLLQFSDNSPFLMKGNNNVYVYAVSANLIYSDIPVKPLFPILIKQLLGYFSSKEILIKNLNIGEKLTESSDPNISGVIYPDGKLTKSSIERVEIPGIYELKYRNKKNKYLNANIEVISGESDLKKITISELKKILGKTSIFKISADKYFEKNIKKILYGSEIYKILIIILLLLFIAETIIANPRKT
ncbi:MAG: hypothetical protein A2474_02350 [Elusimicrobia bacterium RIFOXYC2_FULL_34_12]|nr:MAG: hypothetical protein A2474_02350 [Elusimicrobia bacterium RIFOXYC2_FULL_34_12]OGS38810.1 MAG: hypothetical protein A2551_00860 [Elusimicrobia bacterium RIFOXYD2_FULL_34_30]HAM38646.1 hypothetical protein [Elusimicrobiota bacterium]